MGKHLEAALRAEGVKVHCGTSIKRMNDLGSEMEIQLAGVGEGADIMVRAEYVLVAAGRGPVGEDLGLATAGVATDAMGWIITDEHQRTTAPGILAIGDVTGKALLAHVASRQGIVAVEKLAGLSPEPVRVDRIPSVTYTDPEVASVGLTEAKAREAGAEITIGTFPFAANGRALAHGNDRGLVKIVADSHFGRVLGVHMVGPHVAEMIAEAVLALELESTLDELASVVRAHPSFSEAVGEAALAALGRALHCHS
jgi:dihydrolipoamide dehydrogenase